MSMTESETEVGYFAPDLIVRGSVDGAANLEVAGVIEGDVRLAGPLRIDAGGRVTGPVRAETAEIAGVVAGPVSGSDVRILAGGRVVGDVRAARIGLDDGGILDGSVEMDVNLPATLLEEFQEPTEDKGLGQ